MRLFQNNWLKSVLFVMTLILISLFNLPVSMTSNLVPTQTPFTGYQPQFQIFGDKIYYVCHEYDGPFRQIFTAEMNIDGTGWQPIQRTMAGFDKYTPQLEVAGGKIYYVWEESDGKNRQIWTAGVKQDGTGWQAEKRTKSPYGKYDPHFQSVGNRIYYVWHEDHGAKEPIWIAEEYVSGLKIK